LNRLAACPKDSSAPKIDLNDERRPDRFIQKSRRLWVQGGFHPPREDPRQENPNS
jgi:hypothetical protein